MRADQTLSVSTYCVCVLVTQSCLTLCDPMDCGPLGSSVHGILQARILEWAACPPPRDLPNPGIKLSSTALQADSLLSEPPGKPYQLINTENRRQSPTCLVHFLSCPGDKGLISAHRWRREEPLLVITQQSWPC